MNPLTRKSKLVLLFLCGFMVGIYLEIIFIEKGSKTLSTSGENKISFYDHLKEGGNVTCLVLMKNRHLRYLNSSKKTWLKHCNNHHIVNVRRLSNNAVKRVSEGEGNLRKGEEFHDLAQNYSFCSENDDIQEISAKNAWSGLCRALQFVNPNYTHWIVISPDSLIILVENIRHFVQNLNWNEGHYYGYALKNYQANYNVLSAGILLSRGSLIKLLERFNTKEDCDNSGKYWKNEDLYLGTYLKQLNIFPKDTRDEAGRGRFHGFNMNSILWPGKLYKHSDYHRKALYPVPEGFECCSPFLISLGVSNPVSMQNLYFYLYILKTRHKTLPEKVEVNQTEGTFWKDFLRKEGYSENEIQNMKNEEYYKIWEMKLPQEKMYQEIQNFLKKEKLN